jgi:hypothetical protein
MKSISPITFIDKLVKKNELGQAFMLTDDQREILRLAFAFDSNGCLPWDTIIYSCVKKSGKTTLNRALCFAGDSHKSRPTKSLSSPTIKTMEGIIAHDPELKAEA